MSDDWVDVTTQKDNYQVEYSKSTDLYRHRRFPFGGNIHKVGTSSGFQRTWTHGRPPSGDHSKESTP